MHFIALAVALGRKPDCAGAFHASKNFVGIFVAIAASGKKFFLMSLTDMKCRDAKPWPALGAMAAPDEFLHLRRLISN